MAKILLSKDYHTLYLQTIYSEKENAKAIPSHRWNPDYKMWYYPVTVEVISAIKDKFPEAYVKTIRPHINFFNKLCDGKLVEEESTPRVHQFSHSVDKIEGLRGELMPFQKEGVAYALQKKRTFIADEMGLGKTVQAIATLQAAQAYPAVIITPSVVKLNWEREARRWLPEDREIHAVKNGKDLDTIENSDVVIINYELVSKMMDSLMERPFRMLIMDESHYAKNPKSQRTKAISTLSKGVEYILLLSGTPLLNRPCELISQLKIMGRLREFGGWSGFVHKYCDAVKTRFGWDISGSSNLKELNAKLRNTCYIRRNKKAVLKDLPDKRRSEVVFELPAKSIKVYKKAKDDLVSYLRDNLDKSEEEIERAKKAEALVKIEVLKQVSAQLKLEQATEWIHDFLETGEKLLVFMTHHEMVDTLKKEFPDAITITGDTSTEDKQAAIDKFQNDPNTKLALLGLKAANIGITMTAASNVAFLELGWTPSEMEQAEDRVYRIGQKNSVNVWYLLAADTIDMQIASLIDRKHLVTKATADGKDLQASDGILKELIKELLKK